MKDNLYMFDAPAGSVVDVLWDNAKDGDDQMLVVSLPSTGCAFMQLGHVSALNSLMFNDLLSYGYSEAGGNNLPTINCYLGDSVKPMIQFNFVAPKMVEKVQNEALEYYENCKDSGSEFRRNLKEQAERCWDNPQVLLNPQSMIEECKAIAGEHCLNEEKTQGIGLNGIGTMVENAHRAAEEKTANSPTQEMEASR